MFADLPYMAEIPVPLITVSLKKSQFSDSTLTTLRNSKSEFVWAAQGRQPWKTAANTNSTTEHGAKHR